ncbi:MAG: hypothetical protein IK064_04905 [Clostridia bacterium]|nr:hypothetical protein [Clostridia bacterium]
MKRFMALAISILLCIPLLICCVVKPSNPETEEISVSPSVDPQTLQPDIPVLTYHEVYNPDTDYDNNVGTGFSTLLNTENAYYWAGISGRYLYYYDKSNGDMGVLCPKPECTHDQEMYNYGCAGYLDAFTGQAVCMYEGKIYFFRDTKGKALFRMNPDGTEKERLLDIECEPEYVPQRTAIHRGKLYGVSYASVVRDGEPFNITSVSSWDLETGEFKLIYEEEIRSLGIAQMFFFGDYVYFSCSYPNYRYIDEDTQEYLDTTLKVCRYDTKTEQVEELLNFTDPNIKGSRYALWVEAEDKIYTAPLVANGGDGDPTAVYLVTGGKLEKVFELDWNYNIHLFDGMIVADGTTTPNRASNPDPPKLLEHFLILDYTGNVLYEGDKQVDPAFAYGEDSWQTAIERLAYCQGMLAADNAFFMIYVYGLKPEYYSVELTAQGKGEKSWLVKYELIDGELVETIIGVEKYRV